MDIVGDYVNVIQQSLCLRKEKIKKIRLPFMNKYDVQSYVVGLPQINKTFWKNQGEQNVDFEVFFRIQVR